MIPAPALASRQQALVPQTAEFIKDLVAQPGAMIVTLLLFSVHFVDLGERVRVRLWSRQSASQPRADRPEGENFEFHLSGPKIVSIFGKTVEIGRLRSWVGSFLSVPANAAIKAVFWEMMEVLFVAEPCFLRSRSLSGLHSGPHSSLDGRACSGSSHSQRAVPPPQQKSGAQRR